MHALIDGVLIDLDRAVVAMDGTRWLWNRDITESGNFLMARLDGPSPILPLPIVLRGHGPIVPDRQPTTAAMYRQALLAEAA
ncbi:phiSA1p31-related protein [Streptomyces sp. NPDC048251]|uniref:phiSA1p31-related protein n=1 Tax=Streptomyces sp. NPDC048251 TaxID=3154501 RepID=UPI00342B0BA5